MNASPAAKTKHANKQSIDSQESGFQESSWLETNDFDSDFAADTNDLSSLDSGTGKEQFRKTKRKPPRRRSLKNLLAENQDDYKPEEHVKFDDPGLQELFERDLVHELVTQLKSGKEATVYIARGPAGLAAAKLYVDSRVRSFKNDSLYRGSRQILNARLQKAIDQRTRTGVNAQNFLWVQEEFNQLSALHLAGVCVPKPLALAGNVVLMEFIGDENGEPAQRLSDCKLTLAEATDAFQQSVENMGKILATGRVHGDYSTFNILWWQGRCVVIDFPQVVLVNENPAAAEILQRDVQGLCKTFRTLGVRAEWTDVLRQVQSIAKQQQSQMPLEEMIDILREKK